MTPVADDAESRRKSSRVEIFAQAEVAAREVHIMEVRNVSAGGIYLVGTPKEYPDLVPGLDLGLVIFGAVDGLADNPRSNITCRGRIIRIDDGYPGKRPAGFGATIDPVDDEQRERLAELLEHADAYRVGDLRR